jgi:SAM-dependent methyltransferase
MTDYKEFWETCPEIFAHLTIDQWLGNEEKLFTQWKTRFLNNENINLTNAKIVDYGCGGGYLGKLLLSEYVIDSYTGIDIAERSIKTAKENLKDFVSANFSSDITKIPDCDIIVCQAVIQHLQNLQEANKVFNLFNKSKAKKLVLQLKHADSPQLYLKNESEIGFYTEKNIVNRIKLPVEEVDRLLTNYNRVWLGNQYGSNRLYYVIYELKKAPLEDPICDEVEESVEVKNKNTDTPKTYKKRNRSNYKSNTWTETAKGKEKYTDKSDELVQTDKINDIETTIK